MRSFNDQLYINQLKNGDIKAFEALVNQYKDMVFSIALKICQNKENAEEIAQDSFIKVYKSIDKFKGDAKFSTWIYRITYNTSLDYIKKYKNEEVHYKLDDITLPILIETENALDKLEKEEHKLLIKKCLGKLNPADELILTLYYFKEQSLQEIVTITGKSYDQVRTNLHRSRKKLTLILNRYLEPEIIKNYG